MAVDPTSTKARWMSPAAAAGFARRLQARGHYGFALQELLKETGLSPAAAKGQLHRLAPGIVPFYPRSFFYLIVPPEHLAIGAPPVTWWIDDFFAIRAQPYYLGLLTAAAHHGSSHEAPQMIQIVTDRPLNPVRLGRQKIVFVTKKSAAETPAVRATGGQAPFQVSTAEATLLDLLYYPEHVGGLARIAELARDLKPKLSGKGLRQALDQPLDTALLQRAGFLLEALGLESESRIVDRALKGRRRRPTALEAGTLPKGEPDPRWRVTGSLPELESG
ncbi:type IV toxin-antitoxin system AbiEi family antitoxin [Pelagibius sp. 7325]|uniref:type IV toxin-antitoxin system AbiEi family antitoxin n=1 Tax=Pelagibius sp. 7325 TaxID=3131994 RepID=UPI0030EB1B8E